MKFIIGFFALVIGGMIYLQQSLQSGKVLQYIDTHPQEKWVPESTYYIGQGYYLFQNLQDATTYFLRVAQRYPDRPQNDLRPPGSNQGHRPRGRSPAVWGIGL